VQTKIEHPSKILTLPEKMPKIYYGIQEGGNYEMGNS
jgi:hypothetical protein